MQTIALKEASRLVAEGSELTHGERMRLAEERLHTLVDYAREHSPYLAERYRNLPEDYTLSDLPVIEKGEVVNHFDSYVTDREVRLSDVEAFCNEVKQAGRLYLDKYTVLHTSGTTGKPLYMVRDDHRNKLHGQLMNQRLMRGLDPGILDIRKHKMAAVIFAERGASSYESALRMLAAFPEYRDNFLIVNVMEDTATIVRKLNEFMPEVISAYGSVLALLAMEQEKGNLHISPAAVFNSAEMLTPENHVRVAKAFGCPVKNNYCMTEGGEIAMTWDGPELLLNEDFILIEPVDAERRPVADPEAWSEGILVTDLTNFVQPVIRYFVNDKVKVERLTDDTVRLPVLRIQGRANEIFQLCGEPFTTAGIDSITELYPGVVDFQFTQVSDDELRVRAVTEIDMDREEILRGLAGELENYFHTHGCPEAKVSASTEPPIKKERGGKAPRYIDLRAKETQGR